MRCSRSSSRLAPNDVSAGSIPNARDPERADGALLDQPAHRRGAEVRVLLYLRSHVEYDRGVEAVAGIELVRGGLVRGEVRERGPVRARLLAGHQGLQVVAVPFDRGGRADLDQRVTGEGGAAGRDYMAEEDNSGEAERGGTGPVQCAHAAANQGAGSW